MVWLGSRGHIAVFCGCNMRAFCHGTQLGHSSRGDDLRSPAVRLLCSHFYSETLNQSDKLNETYRYREMKSQKVAVIGTGAVGGYYGARLVEAGHDVFFQMRGANYTQAKKTGLKVVSPDGDIHIPSDRLQAFESTEEMKQAAAGGPFDWVLVALKSTAMNKIPDMLAPIVGKNTRIFVVMNGLVEDELIRLLRVAGIDFHTVYGGMAFICAERTAPALVEHTRYGPISFGLAETCDATLDHEKDIKELFAGCCVCTSLEKSLLRGRWKKMMVNLAFNGLCVAMGGVTVDKIAHDPLRRRLAETIMDEAASIGNADMARLHGKENFEPLGEKEKVAMMTWCDGVGKFSPSTMVDFVNGRPMEVRFLFREPLIRAARLGIEAPALESVVSQIEALAGEAAACGTIAPVETPLPVVAV